MKLTTLRQFILLTFMAASLSACFQSSHKADWNQVFYQMMEKKQK